MIQMLALLVFQNVYSTPSYEGIICFMSEHSHSIPRATLPISHTQCQKKLAK